MIDPNGGTVNGPAKFDLRALNGFLLLCGFVALAAYAIWRNW